MTENLDELFQAMKNRDPSLPPWHSLATFGGREPDDTEGVWSWDAERLLIGSCADDLEIVSRKG